jgi:hypothetical protein
MLTGGSHVDVVGRTLVDVGHLGPANNTTRAYSTDLASDLGMCADVVSPGNNIGHVAPALLYNPAQNPQTSSGTHLAATSVRARGLVYEPSEVSSRVGT